LFWVDLGRRKMGLRQCWQGFGELFEKGCFSRGGKIIFDK